MSIDPLRLAIQLGSLRSRYKNTREQLYKYERQRYCVAEPHRISEEEFLARFTTLQVARRLIFDRYELLSRGLDVEPLPPPWDWSAASV